jgi:hypothetical protein
MASDKAPLAAMRIYDLLMSKTLASQVSDRDRRKLALGREHWANRASRRHENIVLSFDRNAFRVGRGPYFTSYASLSAA